MPRGGKWGGFFLDVWNEKCVGLLFFLRIMGSLCSWLDNVYDSKAFFYLFIKAGSTLDGKVCDFFIFLKL